jgi:transcriptional regulator with GAF, ATPase, and Fis domain
MELAETLAEVARVLMAEDDLDATLDRVCTAAVDTLEACEFAGISMIKGGRVASRATTNGVPRCVDDIQTETQQGPCVDAIYEHEVFLTGDLSTESRWPEFSKRAHEETGIESILAFRLYAEEDTMGALNLYSTQLDAFDDHDVAVGAVFATHAAVAFGRAKLAGDLEAKAEGRDVIGVAKGLIMARSDVGEDEAFEMLRRASQRMNVKVREVASRMAKEGPTGGSPSA